jgi:hypothetical protein
LADEETPGELLRVEFGARQVKQIEFFFATYNGISGKSFRVLGFADADHARKQIQNGIKCLVAAQL